MFISAIFPPWVLLVLENVEGFEMLLLTKNPNTEIPLMLGKHAISVSFSKSWVFVLKSHIYCQNWEEKEMGVIPICGK